jgi:hypothetical protein
MKQKKMIGFNITEQSPGLGEDPLDGRQGGPHNFFHILYY